MLNQRPVFRTRRLRALGFASVLVFATIMQGQPPPPDGPPPSIKSKRDKREIIDTLPKWREADRQLIESAKKFSEMNKRMKKIHERLAEARENLDSEGFAPSDVFKNRTSTGLMGELDEILSDLRKQRERIGRIAWGVSASRGEIGRLLDARRTEIEVTTSAARTPEETSELDRVLAWQRSLTVGLEEGPQEFYLALLGKDLAPELLESVREGRRPRGGKDKSEFRSPNADEHLSPEANAFDPRRDDAPEAMDARIRRLERSQRTQQAVIRRQREEIESLKARLSQYEPVDDESDDDSDDSEEPRNKN